ncbi:anaerobic ribonucleoside-triphosphate reductase [Natrinema sp. DC36]|uniref:anaerobic ribonucleoside-triphosphate reductase n=1 Tax=Natrinema sp. DC36 TaxID=2878680 RepID=UPI001CF0A467|nr:anaerobic ribonucleoside-triphosphate reductase [Natrinema sp. DC36]
MVETGETPTKEGDEEALEEVRELDFGQTVYDEDGDEIGRIRGFERSGFFVTTREGVEAMSVEHARSGQSFGEAELMWRCMECGEMGDIEGGLPDECPNCGTEREDLMYWTED